jgi:hypothetical protein
MWPGKASGHGTSDVHEARRDDLLGRRIDAEANPSSPKLHARSTQASGALTLYDGRRALGFIRPLGAAGFEALTIDRRSLGTFRSLGAAADAIEEARR